MSVPAFTLLLAAGLFACGEARQPKTHQVQIKAMQFVPAELEVAVGDTVVWTNTDVVPHTVTSASPSAAKFDSQMLTNAQQWRYQVTTSGIHAYVCTYHPTMHARIVAR